MTDREHIGISVTTGQGKSAAARAVIQGLETWLPIPGAGHYEASDFGHIRSLDRTIGGRFHKGVVLKLRPDADGYLRVNYTDDSGQRHHAASVARLVLMAHDLDGYFEGAQACHGPGGRQDNRRVNLRWDTGEANRAEALEVRLANTPLKVKPPKTCPRCEREHTGKGRNCHACVVQIGEQAAYYLAEGTPLDKVAEVLDYSPVGVFNLAKRYGGLRCVIAAEAVAPVPLQPRAVGYRQSRPSRLRRVLFRREPSRQNSDGR